MLPGTTLPLQVRFADSEAQKHLKHSMSQKHTLESLGLGPFVAGDARAVGDHALQYPGIERIRSASELDAAVAHAQKMAKVSTFQQAADMPTSISRTTGTQQMYDFLFWFLNMTNRARLDLELSCLLTQCGPVHMWLGCILLEWRLI